jgi:hypothetical protein
MNGAIPIEVAPREHHSHKTMSYEKKLNEGATSPEYSTGETYPAAHGSSRFNPFRNFRFEVDHQPSSFAPSDKWSNKGTFSSLLVERELMGRLGSNFAYQPDLEDVQLCRILV